MHLRDYHIQSLTERLSTRRDLAAWLPGCLQLLDYHATEYAGCVLRAANKVLTCLTRRLLILRATATTRQRYGMNCIESWICMYGAWTSSSPSAECRLHDSLRRVHPQMNSPIARPVWVGD